MKDKAFQIVLWLHDGVYASVTQRGREGRYMKNLVREVDSQVLARGFATRLEVKKLE